MDRPYGISDFAFPSRWDRESGPDLVERAGQGSRADGEQSQDGRERDRIPLGLVTVSIARLRFIGVETGNTRYANQRFVHSQMWASFASCQDDLVRFGYQRNHNQMETDIRSLIRQGLVEQRTIEGHSSYSTKVLTLTKGGHRLLKRAQLVSNQQATYHGLAKPKEARHDAELYRLYQKVAKEIERSGGKVRRVILDLELKKDLYQAISRMRPDKDPAYERIAIASQFDLKVVNDKIPIPDLRIEYEDECRDVHRLDLEVATRDYRPQGLGEKAKAGFQCLPGNKTMTDCAAYSIPRKSPRGFSHYEIPSHTYGCSPQIWLYRGRITFPLPCGHAFRVFHLSAVFPVHQDETRQTQRCLRPEGPRKGTPAPRNTSGMVASSIFSHAICTRQSAERIFVSGESIRLNTFEPGSLLSTSFSEIRTSLISNPRSKSSLFSVSSWDQQESPSPQTVFRGYQGRLHRSLFRG